MIAKASTKKGSVAQPAGASALGLIAIGSSGPWAISIDQTTSGRKRLLAQIEGPAVELRFEIASLNVIDEAFGLLAEVRQGSTNDNTAREMILGHSQTIAVRLVRDDEFADRCFVLIESKTGVLARFTVAGDDLVSLSAALSQVQDDLKNA